MYHTHFGLERDLFGDGIAADAAVFRTATHEEVSARFKVALGSPSSVVVLRGPAGVGKTTLTSAALRAISTRLALAWLNATPTNAAELLELVLVELGVATARTTRIERVQLWRQFQAEMRATESRLFVVVERTEDLAPEVLHALDSLTAADAAGNLGANVVLLGHAGIDEHLAAPVLESLRQRIRLRTELTPLAEAELEDYLRHQIACAGGHYDRVLAPGAVAALFRHSGGVTRLANTLCATALELAASDNQKLLTAEWVTKTAVSLLGLAEVPALEPSAAVAARPALSPVATAAASSAMPAAAEFDDDATVTDVEGVDFPVLTDAVELPAAPAAYAEPAPVPEAVAAAHTKPISLAATPPPKAVPAARPSPPPTLTSAVDKPAATRHIEPPQPASKTASVEKPAPVKHAPPAAAAPATPSAPARTPAIDPDDDDDLLRQTQTMRAIAVAKSIDDISSSMAETLFGNAELDLVTAALASAAAEWSDDEQSATAPPASKPEPPQVPEPVDDPFDLFGLGADALLELIDDSPQPSPGAARKTAAR